MRTNTKDFAAKEHSFMKEIGLFYFLDLNFF